MFGTPPPEFWVALVRLIGVWSGSATPLSHSKRHLGVLRRFWTSSSSTLVTAPKCAALGDRPQCDELHARSHRLWRTRYQTWHVLVPSALRSSSPSMRRHRNAGELTAVYTKRCSGATPNRGQYASELRLSEHGDPIGQLTALGRNLAFGMRCRRAKSTCYTGAKPRRRHCCQCKCRVRRCQALIMRFEAPP